MLYWCCGGKNEGCFASEFVAGDFYQHFLPEQSRVADVLCSQSIFPVIIPQTKQASSRAMAVLATLGRHRLDRRIYLRFSRSFARSAYAMTAGGLPC
jgi:hypothetical protein